jgi:hypothetical protein
VTQARLSQTRRAFLARISGGLGYIALADLLRRDLPASPAGTGQGSDHWPGVLPTLHHAPRAKRLIFLYMAGGPSHLESFDYKPTLEKMHGRPIPPSILKGEQLSPNERCENLCVRPLFPFQTCGQSGQSISTLFPHLARVADDLCILRTLKTDSFVHDIAHTIMGTGSLIPGRPSIGSWLWYGLGSEAENLPGYVLLNSRGSATSHPLNRDMTSNGFLPTRFSPTELRSKGEAVLYLQAPAGVSRQQQQQVIRSVQSLDRLSPHALDDPEVATHVAQYEMAFRMQTSVPELVDLSTETAETLALYGIPGADGTFAANCLIARRLAERGVRFIQLVHLDWDHHYVLRDNMPVTAREVDQGMTALIEDLKRRGMLDDTLVIWGGEFGRTPVAQFKLIDNPGRDHHNKCFSMWLAGGGVKAGLTYGETDEFGFQVVRHPIDVHDLHATILHLLGIDHERLTFRYQGRDFRLTDVSGRVVHDILA